MAQGELPIRITNSSVASRDLPKKSAKLKVRTGCLTCKQRRVKCDEARPLCHRCAKAGKECGGYARGSKKAVLPPLLPRGGTLSTYCPSLSIQARGDELRYFKLYEQQAAVKLAGYYPAEFWTRLVLQDSHKYDFVKHAVIAVGALYKSRETSGDGKSQLSNVARSDYKEVSLRQYQKAVHGLRCALEKKSVSIRATLVCCLMFVCFEVFQGNTATAIKQISSGFRLLNMMKPKAERTPSILPRDSTSPELYSIELEIAPVFARLSVQLRSLNDNKSFMVDEEIINTDNLFRTPFERIRDARYAFDILLARGLDIYHYAAISRYCAFEDIPVHILQFRTEYLTLMDRYYDAFAPLYLQISTHSTDDREHAAALIILMQRLISYIIIQTSLDAEETAFDAYLSDFRQIVTFARKLRRYFHLETPEDDQPFTFDTTCTMPLLLTSVKCRDRTVRREAISLLGQTVQREGVWDPLLAARIATWIVSVEEEGLDPDGTVPEAARVVLTSLAIDLPRHVADVQCGRRIRETSKPVNVRNARISWGDDRKLARTKVDDYSSNVHWLANLEAGASIHSEPWFQRVNTLEP